MVYMVQMKKYKGVTYGIAYGLVARGIFALDSDLMTLSFIFLVPFVIGLIVAYHHDTITSARKIVPLAMPLYAIIGLIAVTVLMGFEGLICALMALPIFAFMALLGGFIGVRVFYRRKDKLTVSVLILMPFLVAPLENYFG